MYYINLKYLQVFAEIWVFKACRVVPALHSLPKLLTRRTVKQHRNQKMLTKILLIACAVVGASANLNFQNCGKLFAVR